MNSIKAIGDIIVSSWIWNITFDWYHPLLAFIFMFCFLRFILKQKSIEAIGISFFAQVFAFGLLSAIVVFGLVYFFNWQFEPLHAQHAIQSMKVFMPSITLAIIYALNQTLLLAGARCIWSFNITNFIILVWASNGCAAFFSYMLIRMTEFWYYVG